MSRICIGCGKSLFNGDEIYRIEAWDGRDDLFCVPCGEDEFHRRLTCAHDDIQESVAYDADGCGYTIARCVECDAHGFELGWDSDRRAAELARFEAQLAEERITALIAKARAGA